MPKLLEFFLTQRLPCAFLVVLMLTSAYWLNVLFGSVPLLGFLLVLVGMMLHLIVPSLITLVLFGGGFIYALQVGGIAALAILFISAGSIEATLIFLGLFVLIPVTMGLAMIRQGLGEASWRIAVLMFMVVIIGLMMSMGAEAGSMKDFVAALFQPMFANMLANMPAGEMEAVASLRQLQDILIETFPGLLMVSLWMIWWGNLFLARKFAKKYNFYRGDQSPALALSLPQYLVYLGIALALLSALTSGDVQYIANNALLLLLALVSMQGVAVAHVWLQYKGMKNTLIVMYVVLFFWSVMVVVCTMIGLLDFWFNFRRNSVSTTGEK